MNGMVPDFIRGIRMVRYQCYRLKSFKKLSRLLPATTNLHVRPYAVNSTTLDLLRTYSVPKSENVEKVALTKSDAVKTDNVIDNDRVKQIMKELKASDNVKSASLDLMKDVLKMKNITWKERVKLMEDLMEGLRSHKVTITEDHYKWLFEAYLKNRSFPNTENLLSQMKKDSVKLSETLQKSISKYLSEAGKPNEIVEIIEMLKKSKVNVDESMYKGLIYGYSALGDVDTASNEYNRLTGNANPLGKDLEFSLLKGLIHQGNESLVKDKLTDIIVSGYKFSDDDAYSLFQTISENQHFHLIPHVAQASQDYLVNNLKDLLTKLIISGNVENALSFLCSLYKIKNETGMHNFQLPPNIHKQFIDALISVDHPLEDLIAICRELRKIEECQYVMEYLLYNCIIKNDLAQSLEVIYALAECGAPIEPHYFWPIIVQARKSFKTEGIYFAVSTMFSVGTYPDSETMLKYVYPYLSPLYMSKSLKVMSPSSPFFQFFEELFILYALENNHVKECEFLLRLKPMRSQVKYDFLEKSFLKAFREGYSSEELLKILDQTDGVDPFQVIADIFENGDVERLRTVLNLFLQRKMGGRSKVLGEAIMKKPNLPEDIKRGIQTLLTRESRDRSKISSAFGDVEIEQQSLYDCFQQIEKEEIHLAELEAKNMNTFGQLFKLTKYYMKVGLYAKALKIRDNLINNYGSKLELSPAYLSSMCRLYEYEKNKDECLRYYKILRENYPTFLIDVPKSTHLCLLFIHNGLFGELTDLIERMPKWQGNVAHIEHKMVKILKAVASLGVPEITQDIFDRMLQKNLIVVNRNTVHPFHETYLTMRKFDEAVNEFERCIQQYGVIPVWNSFMWEIIKNNKLDKMERVLNIVIDGMDGNKDVVYSTLRAVACFQNIDIFKKYLQMYDISLDNKKFKRVLEWIHFSADMNLRMRALQTFILASKHSYPLMKFYAAIAVEHVCCDRDGAAAQNLSNFLREMNIAGGHGRSLNVIIALSKSLGQFEKRTLPWGTTKEVTWSEFSV